MAERAKALNQQIGYALAILLSCLLVGFFTYQSGHNAGTKQASAAEYEQAAKRNARIACRDLEPDAIADCVHDEIGSAIKQSESEQNLNAQQWMVWWAGVLTVITAITTIISWVALRYLRETFRETAKMAGKTEQATDAMVKANDIALQAQRPWLQIEVALREIAIGEDWNSIYFEATVTNIGQMVAERCAVRLAIVDDDTTARGQMQIGRTRAQVEDAAKGVVEQRRSPYPMLPRQSEAYGLKRDSKGSPWCTESGGQKSPTNYDVCCGSISSSRRRRYARD